VSRGLGDVYKRQYFVASFVEQFVMPTC
jgi:hypothetical protein